MNVVAEVKLWGKTIGVVSQKKNEVAKFQYIPEFVNSGIQVSPITMPLSDQVYSFPELPKYSFNGLPGLLSDSLPDKYGNNLINTWLATQGRNPDSFQSVERLCYTGKRGMGALEYYPTSGPDISKSDKIHLSPLIELASKILSHRESLDILLKSNEEKQALNEILRIGTSAGGARAKALIAWNPDAGEIRSGQTITNTGLQHWILKFDGVSNNGDKGINDPKGYCAIEYAYYKMACVAGIIMTEAKLLEENGRRHFLTKRFDRTKDGKKIHMQSLSGLAHFDFNASGAYSYEQVFQIIRYLGLSTKDIEQQFLRMIFNVMARNQDDHPKNIAFLMNKSGEWSLSPAFDITYSYNPTGMWTSKHQMTISGKQDHFTIDDIYQCGEAAILKKRKINQLINQVNEALKKWPEIADTINIPENTINKITRSFRTPG